MKLNAFVFLNLSIFFAFFTLSENSLAQTKNKNIYHTTPASLKRWELRTAPLALLARWYTLDISYRLSKNWATGPTAIYYGAEGEYGNMFLPTYKGYALGWNANYYFTSASSDTWYLSGRFYQESYKSYPHAYAGYKRRDGFRASSVLGYQWRWTEVSLLAGLGMELGQYREVSQKNPINGIEQNPVNSNPSYSSPFVEVKLGIEI